MGRYLARSYRDIIASRIADSQSVDYGKFSDDLRHQGNVSGFTNVGIGRNNLNDGYNKTVYDETDSSETDSSELVRLISELDEAKRVRNELIVKYNESIRELDEIRRQRSLLHHELIIIKDEYDSNIRKINKPKTDYTQLFPTSYIKEFIITVGSFSKNIYNETIKWFNT